MRRRGWLSILVLSWLPVIAGCPVSGRTPQLLDTGADMSGPDMVGWEGVQPDLDPLALGDAGHVDLVDLSADLQTR